MAKSATRNVVFFWTIYILFYFSKISLEETTLKITAPEFMCKRNDTNDVNETETQDFTKIRLSSEMKPDVKYEWHVNFVTLKKKTQRLVLLLWKRVRELQKLLQKNLMDIFQEGLFNLNNSLLAEDVQYNFELITIEKNGTKSSKSFSIEYTNPSLETIESPKISLLLYGPVTIYTDIPYIAFAEVVICSEVDEYMVHWTVKDPVGKVTYEKVGDNLTLVVPRYLLDKDRSYKVSCSLETLSGSVIVSKFQYVDVFAKKSVLILNATSLVIGQNDTLRVDAMFEDFNDPQTVENVTINWTLVEEPSSRTSTDPVTSMESSTFYLKNSPPSGNYTLQSIARDRNGRTLTQTSMDLEVLDETQIPKVTLPLLDDALTNFDTQKNLRVPVSILNLAPGCEIEWICVDRAGCDCVDLRQLPDGSGKPKKINSIDELFLNDISDLTGDESLTLDYDLKIPPGNGSAWAGLSGGTCYLFRLTIDCTIDFLTVDEQFTIGVNETVNATDSDGIVDVADVDGTVGVADVDGTVGGVDVPDLITHYHADVMIWTNAPPILNGELIVEPMVGRMDVTRFLVKADTAQDRPGDGPVLFQFFYRIHGNDAREMFCERYEISNCDAVVTVVGRIIFSMKACDVWMNCNEVQSETVIVS